MPSGIAALFSYRLALDFLIRFSCFPPSILKQNVQECGILYLSARTDIR